MLGSGSSRACLRREPPTTSPAACIWRLHTRPLSAWATRPVRTAALSALRLHQYIYAISRRELTRRMVFSKFKRAKVRPRPTGWPLGGPVIAVAPISEQGGGASSARTLRRRPDKRENDTSCKATLVEQMSGCTELLPYPQNTPKPQRVRPPTASTNYPRK